MSMVGQELKIDLAALPCTFSDLETGGTHEITLKPESVPLIILPGIMGTRLKSKKGIVWDPDDVVFMAWNYIVLGSPARRKKRMVGKTFSPTFLTPVNDDDKHNKRFESTPGADDRGWGSLAWGFYGELLEMLQTWNDENKLSQKLPHFTMPVYACGYNWTASNRTSGGKLQKFIADVLQKEAARDDVSGCRQVILISHSMGGIVCRAACMLQGAAASVRAVLHGVQPATGAPVAYFQMKSGSKRDKGLIRWLKSVVVSWVLGSGEEEITALLGNIPGGLELLPNQHYRTNRGQAAWLQFFDTQGRELKELSLPQGGNPYKEIYQVRDKVWSLLEPANLIPEEWWRSKGEVNEAWEQFLERIQEVEAFHQELGVQCHPKTKVFYGKAGQTFTGTNAEVMKYPTFDRVRFEVDEVTWRDYLWTATKTAALVGAGTLLTGGLLGGAAVALAAKWTKDELQNSGQHHETASIEGMGKAEFSFLAPDGSGDGTVPDSSGKALAASLGTVAFADVEHGEAYKNKTADADDPNNTLDALLISFLEQTVPGG